MFKDYKRKLEAITGEELARRIIGERVYIIFAGSNDLLITYLSTSLRNTGYDERSYIDYMVKSASSFIKDLYHLGAQRIGIAGVPPLGCVPQERTLKGGINRDCVESYNQASIMFNSKLSKELERLETNLPGSRIIYMDIYTLLLDLILNPADHGFKESTKGCCGTGNFEASIFCNNLNPFTCTNASNYVFWDSFHPTQRTIEILVPILIENYLPLIF